MPAFLALILALWLALPARADVFHTTDGVIRGGLCVGADCLTHERFGDVTLRLKANVLRLRFDDTSAAASFPSADWELAANDPLAGGANYFALRETGLGTIPFRIAAGAGPNALAVAAGGDVGLGTARPEADLHIRSGNTPAIRLEQDATEGFLPQRWDLGGNEAGLFLRDVDTGALPVRVARGAPSDALRILGDGRTGLGTGEPLGRLHLLADQPNNTPLLVVQSPRATGRPEIWLQRGPDRIDRDALRMQLNGDDFNVSFNGTGGAEFQIRKSGDVRVLRGDLVVPNGRVIVGGQRLNVPDYVFAPDYELMPLADVAAFIAEHSHLPHMPSAAEVQAGGLDMVEMQLALLRSLEEMVLHTLDQEAEIAALRARIAALETAD